MKFESPLSLKGLADMIGAEPVGNDDFKITGINEIHMVEPGDITFVDHPKYYDKALNSKATTILINKKVKQPEGKALLISDDPFRDYVRIVKKFRPFRKSNNFISNTAEIGEGTIIQPGSFIGNHVRIGKNCLIHSNVSIYDHTLIGDKVIIHANSVLGADAYYFQKKNGAFRKMESCGRVVIRDKVEIGALCSIDKGVSGDTIIDEDTKLDNHCQIGHDTYIGKHCLIGSHAAIAGVTRIEDDVILWGRVSINKDIVIGKGAILLATSAVGKSLEGGKTYFGAPAEEVRTKWKQLAALKKLPDFLNKHT
ncbi:MAG: UDP-3-O-(3-hydroxymyristoyl)glucosamine N-acyltransferase [Bacteroidales bacterium]|nr:UDP-3-O-(3-hydroxymyristoyl)glucosamine N-acyltransferase [Bacteroidales bacterium]MCF8387440.1 UDP-3-O-(3-hydroxymyristoyl)glucosamine N-acyltransferase [Bacteroidales bacterium]MCF8396744.1 UDP-3-O-(3-hydroxymyristoyl)glucosamine N-acyltransferase [Bacteroidales bacterium]